jgi:hypothetical protein
VYPGSGGPLSSNAVPGAGLQRFQAWLAATWQKVLLA